MRRNRSISNAGLVTLLLLLINVIIVEQGFIGNPQWYKAGYVTLPLLILCFFYYGRKRL